MKWGELSETEFLNYRGAIISKRKDEYCWLDSYIPHMISVTRAFESLRWKQRKVIDVIHTENAAERTRHSNVNKEYLRRDKKHKNICKQNLRLIGLTLKQYQKYRRGLLKPK